MHWRKIAVTFGKKLWQKAYQRTSAITTLENQLMVNCWFGFWWFGIRIGVRCTQVSQSLSFSGIPGIQTTNVRWRPVFRSKKNSGESNAKHMKNTTQNADQNHPWLELTRVWTPFYKVVWIQVKMYWQNIGSFHPNLWIKHWIIPPQSLNITTTETVDLFVSPKSTPFVKALSKLSCQYLASEENPTRGPREASDIVMLVVPCFFSKGTCQSVRPSHSNPGWMWREP